MDIINSNKRECHNMSLKEIFSIGGGSLLIIMSLIQVAPVKLNPWSALLRWFGNQINGDLKRDVAEMRRDVKCTKLEIETIRNEQRENHAKDCRVRILRFSDEIYLGQNHSQEHFKQILGDITHYEKYCMMHPEFENSIAVAAIEQIKESYNTRLRKHDFLK